MNWDEMTDTEKNILVAKEIMGLVPCNAPVDRCIGAKYDPPLCWGTGEGGSDLRDYVTNIAEAWMVVEEMSQEIKEDGAEWERWVEEIKLACGDDWTWLLDYTSSQMAEKLCLAALKAKGVKI